MCKYIYKLTDIQKDNIRKLTDDGFFNDPVNCCAAEGWEELGRECIDTKRRPILERRANRRIPSSGPIDYNHQQYLDDVKKRKESDKRGYNYNVR